MTDTITVHFTPLSKHGTLVPETQFFSFSPLDPKHCTHILGCRCSLTVVGGWLRQHWGGALARFILDHYQIKLKITL